MEKNTFTRWGWVACGDCGCSIAPETEHECEPERYQSHQVCLMLPGLALAEAELAAYLATPQGAFAAFCAERDRLRV